MASDPAVQRAASRRHYEKNKQYYRDRNARVREQKVAYIRAQKAVPCTDCGHGYEHFQMEFDHLADKVMPVSRMSGCSWRQIKEEIAKCEVVCCNCHARRTWERISPA